MAKYYNVFDLPQDLVESLVPLSLDGASSNDGDPKIESLTPSTDPAPKVSSKSFQQDLDEGKTPECSYCGRIPGASSTKDLRDHYKKDYHRFNIKRKLRNEKPLTENEFEDMAEGLDESISGSESDETDGNSSGDDNESGADDQEVSNLVKKAENLMKIDATKATGNRDQEDDMEDVDGKRKQKVGSPYMLFTSEKIESEKCLGIYKALVDTELAVVDPLRALGSLDSSGQSAVFMLGGGHFSGAIIKHQPNMKNKPTPTNPFSHLEIIAHKGFHRYTTRRKQGGSQAANDSAGGKAKSAGSTLRRYNELALQQEIRELLEEWRPQLNKCGKIYIRANGKHNRAILMNYDDKAPLKKNDPRIRGLPFTTQRATATEIKRAWVELTTARVVEKPKQEVAKPAAPSSSTSASTASAKKPTKAEPTVDEKHTAELTQLIKKSRSPRLVAYLRSNNLTPEFKLQPESQYLATPTLLFYASSQGSHHIVTTLLTQLNADPAIVSEATNRTPFEMASDRSTKDAFQLARSQLGEKAHDWNKAKVGHALTKSQIEARDNQQKQQLAKERADQLSQLEQKQAQEKLDKTIQKHGQGRKIASNVATTMGQDAGLRGLSDEARMRLERERRARAAEARFKKN